MRPDPSTGPLIGRADELERLVGLVGVGEAEPRPGTVLLSGDAGIGKSRLLASLGARAADAGWRVLVGRCLAFGDSALPYLPFGEVFGRLQAAAPALFEVVSQRRPPLQRLATGRRAHAEELRQGTRPPDRSELFAAVHAALEDVGADLPTLVVIEDAHWADRSTLDLLSLLCARQFRSPVAIVVSYRGDDLHRRHPLRAAATQWARLAGVARVELAPLHDVDVRGLIAVLQPAPLRASDVQAIVERAEGNAFFVEELVAATAVGDALPRDLAGLLLVRVDQLDDGARHVVRAASVAGRTVAHGVLSRVAGLTAAALDEAVRAAVDRHILVAASSDGYAFRHALLAESVYDDLLPGERVRLHAAYVAALSQHGVAGSAAELARHARAAGDTATALRWSVRAGDDALSLGGPAEALLHYEHALELSANAAREDADDDADVVTLTVSASAAATAAGYPHKAIALAQDRLDRSSPDLAPTARARLLHALASAALVSDIAWDVSAVTTEALELVPAEPATDLRAHLLSVHAQALSFEHRDDEAARGVPPRRSRWPRNGTCGT